MAKLDTGTIVSGIGHVGLIGWALVGGWFQSTPEAEALQFTEVTMLTGEEFAALNNQPSEIAPEVESPTPEAPVAPEIAETPVQPEAVEEQTVETPDPPQQAPPATEETTPEPPTPLVETEVEPVAPEAPVAPQAVPEDTPAGAALVLDQSTRPKERPAARVAPTPSVAPEPDTQVDTVVQEAAEPEASETATETVEAQEATAPEAANTEIVTEAEEQAGGAVVSALAPSGSPRPTKRPKRPVVQSQPSATDEAVAAAVEAASSATQETAPRPSGPPLTGGEKDALRVAVQQCWNVGSLSTDALRVTVTVGVKMQRNGKPDNGSIRMLAAEGGNQSAAKQAYETARRAIIRCGARGFNLPEEKYSQWAEIEMVFNPERMRIK